MTNLLIIATASTTITGFEHSDDGLRWKQRAIAPEALSQGLNVVTVQDKPMRFVRPIDVNILIMVEAERLMSALGLSPDSSPTFKGLTVTNKIAGSNIENGFFGRGPAGQPMIVQALPQEGPVDPDLYMLITIAGLNYIIPMQQT